MARKADDQVRRGEAVADRLRPCGRPCFAAGKAVDRFILPEPGQRREDIGLTLGATDGRAVGEVEMQLRRARMPGGAEEAEHLPRLDPVADRDRRTLVGSEERRVGRGCVRTWRSLWAVYN